MRDDGAPEDYPVHVSYGNGSSRIIAWGAGVGAVLLTMAIGAGASALWTLSARVAALEAKMDFVVEAVRK